RAYGHQKVAVRRLEERAVERRLIAAIEIVDDVAADPDDDHPWRGADTQPRANRAAIGPELRRHRLADHRHRLAALTITVRERAARADRQAQRLEIVRTDRAIVNTRPVARRRQGVSFGFDAPGAVPGARREYVGNAGGQHRWRLGQRRHRGGNETAPCV